MALNTKPFATLLSNLVAAIQGAAQAFVDFSVGSSLLAISEAQTALALGLQGLITQVAALTRFSTSNGPDADSWAADFGFFRLPAKPATGLVTFSRATATAQATVQAATVGKDANGNTVYTGGTIVQTADGTEQYQVIPDTTQAAYNATLNVYVLPANTSSISATVQSLTAGSDSNVVAAAINTLGSSIAGVDTVTNAIGFTNGADAESDPAFKARFVLYIQSLAEGTVAAIKFAIQSIQQNVSFEVVEDQTITGIEDEGFFYVVADDGTGNPSSSFLSAVFSAVDAVRPIGSTFAVFPPTLVQASIVLGITTTPSAVHSAIVAIVQTAIANFVNTLPIGMPLPYTRIAQLAYGASPSVINVTGVSLNGGTADLTVSGSQVIKANSVLVS